MDNYPIERPQRSWSELVSELLGWFFREVLIILIVLFVLSNLFGIEFNEYPHSTVTISGNNTKLIWDKHAFCPQWIGEPYSKELVEIRFNFYGENCTEYSSSWVNPDENRITYYLGYEIILSNIDKSNEEVEIEVVDKDRAFLLINGKGFPP